MRFVTLLALAVPVFAGITPGRRAPTDVQILNFMLALEQLEIALYDYGLGEFTPAEFIDAGLPPFTRGRLEQIRKHSEIRGAFLQQAVADSGSVVVEPCTYAFSLEDPRSLISTGRDVATVLASASYGAIGRMENVAYRTMLGSTSGSISRQAGWLNSAVLEKNAWNTAFDAPLTPRQAWTFMQRYISSCPPENAMRLSSDLINLFTPLDVVGILNPGSRAGVKFDKMEKALAERPLYVALMTGIGELRTPLEEGGFFAVPNGAAKLGAAYAFVTSSNGPIGEENILAGPAVIYFDSSSLDSF